MGSSFDTLIKNAAAGPQPSAPAAAPETPSASAGSSFDSVLSKSPAQAQGSSFDAALSSPAAPEVQGFGSPVNPAQSSSFDSILNDRTPVEKYSTNPVLTNDEAKYGQKSPDEMEDEPWYSKSWEWLNSPLYDLHKWGTRTGAGAFEKGLETGLEDIGSGFTSPLQIGLTLATFGGGAVEEAGISVLRAIGVSKSAAPIVATGAKALLTAGFSAQMLGGMITQSPQLLDALKDGDTENAVRLATNLAASGIFLREGLKHGYEDIASIKNYVKGKSLTTTERLGLVQELAGIYDESKSKGTDFARERQEAIVAQLKAAGAFGDEITEAGIRHYMTQDGDMSRIEKMAGIAEGTIKPREWTPEEKDQQDQIAEVREWAKDSDQITKVGKGPEAAPREFFLTDSADGTHKLGQTLTAEKGDAADAHYVQLKNPYSVSSEESLKKFIDQSGGQEQAKKLLQDRGYDGIAYKGADGDPKFVTFDNSQYRPVEQYKEIHDAAWSRDHAYIAVDKKNLPKILNQGIGLDPKRNNVVYHATPGTAIENATLPDSGNKADLVVLSVPRAEVEKGVYETNAAVHAQTNRGIEGPVEVLPRAKRETLPSGTGVMNDPTGEIGQPTKEGYVLHLPIDEDLKRKNDITSDREIHAHELAHSIWAALGKFPLGDIESHKNIQSVPGKYIAAADINIDKFQTFNPKTKQWSWDVTKIKDHQVQPLVDTMMAGTVADEMISGIETGKEGKFRNAGNGGDVDDVRALLQSQGVESKGEQNKVIQESLDRVRKQMRDHGIDDIIKEEFAKGREPNLSIQKHYSRQRLSEIADRVKDIVNGKTTREDNATAPGGEGNQQTQVLRRTQGGGEKAPGTSGETGRPPVADDLLITEKRHMPAHLLEMEEGKDANGEATVRATGRTTPLRPLGAEDLPGNNARFNNAYTPAEKQKYLAGLKAAARLTPEQIEIAKTLRSAYDSSFQRAHENGMIRSWVESYHPQAWANDNASMWHRLFNNDPEEVTNGALNDLRHTTNSGQFDTNINAAKHRAFNTEFQGVMAGEKFKTADLSQHLFNHLKGIEHAQAARDFVNNLRKKDTKAADGRPMVVLQGTARKFGGEENPAVAINPERTQKIHIDPEKIKHMMDPNPQTGTNELQDGLKNGTIEKLPFTTEDEKGQKVAAYAYTSDGYETIDHPAMRAWGYIGQDTAGNPALMHGQMKIHPDIAQFTRQVMGVEGSPVRNSRILSGINTAAGEAKGLLLSLSPFHIVQEGLRAALVGINPLKYDHININDNPTLQLGVRNGLTRNNYQAEDQYSTGFASHSKIISKIPGLNRVQNAMQSFLFDRYIPGLKDRAFLKLHGDILTENPSLTPAEAASRAADMTNDVFGGQNWRKLGVTTAQQDFMRMGLLAPDWLTSEVRMLARASGAMDKETGAISRKQMAIQVGSIWAAARVLNLLATGNMHNEAPFGVAQKGKDGKETVYSVRTLPTDLLHVLSDPEGFIRGRVNPLVVRPAVEALSGRDEQGRRAPAAAQLKDMVQNVAPIIGQGIFKGSSLSPLQQVGKGLGASVARYRTEAEKMADQYASDRMPSGPVDQEHLAAHQKDLALEDALRQGQISKGQLKNQVAARRADEIARRVNMTPLQARFDRLPISEALNVWAAATPSEKDTLHEQLWKKRVAWMKLHTGAERANEPVWRKMQATFADIATTTQTRPAASQPAQASSASQQTYGVPEGWNQYGPKNVPGMIKQGNLDLTSRPVIQNADGTRSSEYSTSFEDEKGQEVLVPTVVDGKFLTPDGKKPPEGSAAEKAMFAKAQQHYEQTGENLGIFDKWQNADAAAEKIHNRPGKQ